jgi:nitroimidazol reductase NimA-like FMN-containing flavoprotein (pyridoxamine 5'-phosphate oxidase superfamily)
LTAEASADRAKARSFQLNRDEAWAVVADSHTGVLITLRRDGYPIALPVWFIAWEGAIYVGSPRRAKKVARVQHDGRASFLVESGERWQDLRAVHYTGIASVLEETDPRAVAASKMLDAKYRSFKPGNERLPEATRAHYAEANRVIIRFEPYGRVLGWDNSRIRLKD